MGSGIKSRAGQVRLGEVLHEEGAGQGGDAPATEHLGVLFKAGWGWGKQLGVLRKKQQEMAKRAREAKAPAPAEVAVYAMNTKVIPALAILADARCRWR